MPLSRCHKWSLLVFVAASLLWFTATFAVFAPGIFNWDAFEQLDQGLTGRYRTTFPIAYAWLLGTSERVFGTVGALWVAQLLLFIGAFAFLAWKGRRPAVVVVACAGLLLPPFWACVVQHWRDNWVAGVAVIAFCAALARRPVVVIACAVVVYQFRSNAFVLVLPLVVVAARDLLARDGHGLGARIRRLSRSGPRAASPGSFGSRVAALVRRRHPRWSRSVATIAVTALVVVACLATQAAIVRALRATSGFSVGPSLAFDIAKLVKWEPQLAAGMNLPDRVLVRATRKVERCSGHYVLDGRVPQLEVSRLARRRDELVHDWLHAVLRRPHLWIAHRVEMATCLLRIGYDPGGRMYGVAFVSRGHHGAGDDAAPRASTRVHSVVDPAQAFAWGAGKILFMPIVWIAAALIVARFALKRMRTRPIVKAFVIGNGLYLLSNFCFAPAPNLRYVFPVVPSAIAIAMVAASARCAYASRGRPRSS